MYLTRSNKILQLLMPTLVWKIPSVDTVFLTFDDGPHPAITPKVLDWLDAYNAKATFFCVGENAQQYPDIIENILNRGHKIGNHTHQHINGWKNASRDYTSNIDKAQPFLYYTPLFRPPYGRITYQQIRQLKNYKIIMWSLLSGDFDVKISKEKCFLNIQNQIRTGDIIVFHDSEKAWERMAYALPLTLALCQEKGFKMDSLPF